MIFSNSHNKKRRQKQTNQKTKRHCGLDPQQKIKIKTNTNSVDD